MHRYFPELNTVSQLACSQCKRVEFNHALFMEEVQLNTSVYIQVMYFDLAMRSIFCWNAAGLEEPQRKKKSPFSNLIAESVGCKH